MELLWRVTDLGQIKICVVQKVPRGQDFITVRNEVAKVMCLQASVCPQGVGGVCLSACWDITRLGADIPQEQTPPRSRHHPPPEQTTPPEQTPGSRHPLRKQRYGRCCGRYASYWNAFLFNSLFGEVSERLKDQMSKS